MELNYFQRNKPDNLLVEICKVLELDIDKAKNFNLKGEFAIARQLAIYISKNNLSPVHGLETIAKSIGLDKKTIYISIDKVENSINGFDKKMLDCFNKVKYLMVD